NLMYARLQNTRNVSMTRVPSLHGFSRTDRAMHKLEFNETTLTHLLLWRAAVSWRTATEVFPGGCSYRPGGQSLSLSHIEVSGGPDIDFCPAFMRLYGASDLWRASSVQGKLCTYALPDTQRRMYCLY
ncbi:MAG: hypothetical protein KDK30_11395, partial [Leptospiraceae bacterium]|nr:hypothetical protein [Leptospiraceae bacterium]